MFAWRRTALRRRVVVSLKTGISVSGVLWAKRGSIIILKRAEILEAGRPPTPADGEIVIESENVDFVQVLPELGTLAGVTELRAASSGG